LVHEGFDFFQAEAGLFLHLFLPPTITLFKMLMLGLIKLLMVTLYIFYSFSFPIPKPLLPNFFLYFKFFFISVIKLSSLKPY
jgi:hypothetical protein